MFLIFKERINIVIENKLKQENNQTQEMNAEVIVIVTTH